MKTQQISQKHFQVKLLTAAVSLLLPAIAAQASDLEIYQPAKEGGGKITFMLDTSGSMKEYDVNGCNTRIEKKKYRKVNIKTDKIGEKGELEPGENITYEVVGCDLDTSDPKYNRITILKNTLVNLLADPKKNIKDDYIKSSISIGSFYRVGKNNVGGIINIPDTTLDYNGRVKIIEEVIKLDAEGGTPSAHAYAEAGAYMLGTTTKDNVKLELKGFMQQTSYTNGWNTFKLYKCTKPSSSIGTFIDYFGGQFEYSKCANNLKLVETVDMYNKGSLTNNGLKLEPIGDFEVARYGGNRAPYGFGYYLFDKKTDSRGMVNDVSGIGSMEASNSATTSDGSKYVSPIKDSEQCKGYGIFFLTDGVPNSVPNKSAIRLMNLSLEKNTAIGNNGKCTISNSGQNSRGQTVSGFVDADAESRYESSWACMAEYSKKLYNAENPKNKSIPTAVVGFGSTFDSLAGESKKIEREFKQKDGTTKSIKVYDCYSAATADARNLCLLGEKSYGFGEGGFTAASSEKDLRDSIVNFLNDTGQSYSNNISTGFMSVPVDELNTLKSRGVAYLPALVPNPGSNNLWLGNLKKYDIKKGSIVGVNGKKVFKERSSEFSKETYDKWNTMKDFTRPDAGQPDLGDPQIGGAYQQIFENSEKTRNLFVDVEGKLVNLSVTKTNGKFKTSGFDRLGETTATVADSPINVLKIQLLRFMGYTDLPSKWIVKDNEEFTAKHENLYANKQMGGVIHSLPKLITTEIKFKNGRFDNDTRKDYVLYGSMEGALHLVDDKTGKEIFNFIPKQTLDLQPYALTGGTSNGSGVPHGVDAPWNVFASFEVKDSDKEESVYKADQIIASGGLRMGGSTYYSLNIKDLDSPKLLYSVGSNYSETLIDSSKKLSGIKKGKIATNKEANAFARFGQTWGEPSIGYVKVGGKKVMVNFLPGGYDMGYESAQYVPTASSPAQGNGVFMVKVGTEEESSDNTTKINFDGSGDLLWWASNKNSDKDNAALIHSIVSEVKTIDRDYDGLTDHLYFADLGGQVWRVDISNKDEQGKYRDEFKVVRVVRVLDVSDRAKGDEKAPRFYESPLITFDNINYGQKQKSKIVAQVTIGSGNRSLPVSEKRSVANSDALYSFIDKDMSKQDLFTNDNVIIETKDLKIAKLDELKLTTTDKVIKENMITAKKEGWYFPLTSWVENPGKADQKVVKDQEGIKSINKPDAIGGVLYVPLYNPNAGNEINVCDAGIVGASQVERLCLPYGNCAFRNVALKDIDSIKDSAFTERSTRDIGVGAGDSIIAEGHYSDDTSYIGLISGDGVDKPDVICAENSISPDCVKNPNIDNVTRADQLLNPLAWMERD